MSAMYLCLADCRVHIKFALAFLTNIKAQFTMLFQKSDLFLFLY